MIYPNEGLLDYQSIIDDILRLDVYSEEALNMALSCYLPDLPYDAAVAALAARGHVCKPEVQWCSDAVMAEINAKWTPPQELTEDFSPGIRPVFCI